jgi:hypothetical protein
MRTGSCEMSYMNSDKDDSKSNQEMRAFDLPPIHEEEVVNPALDDDEKESAEKSEPAQIEDDKEKTEMVTKEAMLRVRISSNLSETFGPPRDGSTWRAPERRSEPLAWSSVSALRTIGITRKIPPRWKTSSSTKT